MDSEWVVERPLWNSVAVAFVTSDSERACVIVFDSSSDSEMSSLAAARLRRDQSTIAMRVLSPGASDVLCSSWPSVTPIEYQD